MRQARYILLCIFEEANPEQTMTRALAMQIKNDDVSNESTPFINMLFNDFWCVHWDCMMTCRDVNVRLNTDLVLSTSMKGCATDAARGQPLKWPTSNKSYRPLTILALRLQFSLGNRFLNGTNWSTSVSQ